MVGDLVMLPVRVGVRATRLWFRAVEETVSMTASATGRVVELLASRSPNGAAGETAHRQSPGSEAAAPPTEEAEPSAPPARSPERDLRSVSSVQTPPSATLTHASEEPATEPTHVSEKPVTEPDHVSEEPELVEEFAEPGAEQGAGAEVTVDPPWDGYDRMTAKEIVARLATGDAAELAAVQLYESTSRRRQTVMNAVERELRSANARRSRTNHPR